jgi:hypothetical protein
MPLITAGLPSTTVLTLLTTVIRGRAVALDQRL